MIVDGRAVSTREGDSVLVAMLRAGLHPSRGGCLCFAGDCPHCLATVDGVAYRRTCQVAAGAATVVESHPENRKPSALQRATPNLLATGACRHQHCDVVVIGQGSAGREAARAALAAGHEVITFDCANRQDVVGIYPGPVVVARMADGTVQARPRREVVVATGAVELHPVAPGGDLRGLVTRRGAMHLSRTGLALGHVVAIGAPPDDVQAEAVSGTLVRFEPRADDSRRLGAIVVRDDDGNERRVVCDTASIGLGLTPRDGLLRMGRGTDVRGIGDVTLPATLPAPPVEGVVCPCLGVTVADLISVHERGFRDLELVKRATLSGTGPCQGAVCVPHLRSFLAHRGTSVQPAFTARPVSRPVTVGEAASGAHLQATARTGLDVEHRRLGARMDRLGGWWRPWTYGDGAAEYRAVRDAVSLGDVSTLGKVRVSGPDAVRLLEYLYPARVSTLAAGRSRYSLLLNERGHVIDDGMICRESETRFVLTFTSGGATQAEWWIRDWAETMEADVRILNQTWSLGAINVTGPRATLLLERAGVTDPPAYLRHQVADVAGVPCRVVRLSFTGEVSYELHHDVVRSVGLWRDLLELGRDLGIRPHGLETLLTLRLEKGHLIVGQDTDFDSTPRRLGLEGMAHLDKGDFVGRRALLRTNRLPLDRRLVGLEFSGPAPAEGALIWSDGLVVGQVTSSAWSPALGKTVMLGWLRASGDGGLAENVVIDGRAARRVSTPFYDAGGGRARA
jgi:glycine cleavage system aminomethyltransferase T